jgi:hypothetical protein
MADLIDKIVKVVITRQTSVPSMKSFSEHLVADMFDPSGITPVFDADHRVRLFSSPSEILEAGFTSDSFIYRAAEKQFSQSPHIGQIYVGLKMSSDASWADTLTAIMNQNNSWYALSTSARTMADQQQIAQWVQANEKLTILATGDDTVINEETGDIASWAKLMNLDRVVVFYHPDAGLNESGKVKEVDPIPEAAYFGKMLTKHPGSPTWKFKDLQAVPTFALTGGQFTTAMNKNATVYCLVADVAMTFEGKTAAGEYIDVIHGLDWLKARIQNLVFTPMKQMDKIPFTDSGIQIIVGQLRAALDEGVRYSILASFDITNPSAAEVPADQKAKRNLPDVNWTSPLAGAIHSTEINGTVTL